MGIFRRTAASKDPDVRVVGRDLALGIVDVPHRPSPGSSACGTECGTCGSPGRIEMIDTTVRRAYLSCPNCGRLWDTDRASVPAQPFFSRT